MIYYNFWGMDFIWWFLWLMLLIWIFAIPYDFPGQQNKPVHPLLALQKRFAAGEIGPGEYNEKKKAIEMGYIQRG